MHEFRSVYRDLISILNEQKDLISFIFTDPQDDNKHLESYCKNSDGSPDINIENDTSKNRILFLLQEIYQ